MKRGLRKNPGIAELAGESACPTEQHSRNQNRADVRVDPGPGGPPHKSPQAAKILRSSGTLTRGAGAFACQPIFSQSLRLALLILTLGLPCTVFGQQPKPAAPAPTVPAPSVDDLWNSLLQGAPAPASQDPALSPPQIGGSGSTSSFENHFYFEGRTDYYRYDTDFNSGVPTVTGTFNSRPSRSATLAS